MAPASANLGYDHDLVDTNLTLGTCTEVGSGWIPALQLWLSQRRCSADTGPFLEDGRQRSPAGLRHDWRKYPSTTNRNWSA